MTLDEVEERLSQERAFLIRAVRSGNQAMISLAQAHVTHWEAEVFRHRLADAGGWKGGGS